MQTIKGPAISLGALVDHHLTNKKLSEVAQWIASLGYVGVELPTWGNHLFNLSTASESQDYCDEFKGTLLEHNLSIVALSCQQQGQLVAAHPTYDKLLDAIVPPEVQGAPDKRKNWAIEQIIMAARASSNLGLNVHIGSAGSLAWPFIHPHAHHPSGLVETAFDELARRWRPILDSFDDYGVDLCFEIQPGSDLFDGTTFDMFLTRLNNHSRCNILYNPGHLLLEQLDYLRFIDIYQQRIKAFHVQDAEFRATGRQGVYSGHQPWEQRACRYRSVGQGQIDFVAVFSQLTINDFNGWAIFSPTGFIKHPIEETEDGASQLKQFIIDVRKGQKTKSVNYTNTLEHLSLLGL
jgi:sugar phosphate isomerase/epimerase